MTAHTHHECTINRFFLKRERDTASNISQIVIAGSSHQRWLQQLMGCISSVQPRRTCEQVLRTNLHGNCARVSSCTSCCTILILLFIQCFLHPFNLLPHIFGVGSRCDCETTKHTKCSLCFSLTETPLNLRNDRFRELLPRLNCMCGLNKLSYTKLRQPSVFGVLLDSTLSLSHFVD